VNHFIISIALHTFLNVITKNELSSLYIKFLPEISSVGMHKNQLIKNVNLAGLASGGD